MRVSNIEYVIISAAISICSLVLLATTLISYRKSNNKKLIFVTLAFLFFLIRGLLLSFSLFYDPLAPFVSSYYTWLIDLVILNLLYLAALKR